MNWWIMHSHWQVNAIRLHQTAPTICTDLETASAVVANNHDYAMESLA